MSNKFKKNEMIKKQKRNCYYRMKNKKNNAIIEEVVNNLDNERRISDYLDDPNPNSPNQSSRYKKL